jgi:cytochrome oxidase assembly protein ShyY1
MSAAKASLLFLPSAVAATMAAWQVQRMQWKVRHVRVTSSDPALHGRDASIHVVAGSAALQSSVCAMHHMPTVILYRLGLDLQQDIVNEATRNMEQQPVDLLQGTVPEFRRVAVQGTYDHSRTAFVGPRPLR